jgi:hypothetical protein
VSDSSNIQHFFEHRSFLQAGTFPLRCSIPFWPNIVKASLGLLNFGSGCLFLGLPKFSVEAQVSNLDSSVPEVPSRGIQ